MQPLRGYDSLSLADLLPGIAPAPLAPPPMPGPWGSGYPGSTRMATPQADSMPPRQSGIARESLRALKQAMARIAPHVPPEVLQPHYIRRLGELSNTTPDTQNPVAAYGSAPPALTNSDMMSGNSGSPQPARDMSRAMDSPFVRAAMARFSTLGGADRNVQPLRGDERPLVPGDVISSIRQAPLSAPNMPSVMDDPRVRAAMAARLATSPAANGHLQPIPSFEAPLSFDDVRRKITAPPLSVATFRSEAGDEFAGPVSSQPAASDGINVGKKQTEPNRTQVGASASNSNADTEDSNSWWDWAPIVGPMRALRKDYKNGDPWSGVVDGVLLGTDLLPGGLLLKAPAWALAKGLAKGLAKQNLEREVGKEFGKIWKTRSNKWKDTKAWILRNYPLPANTHVHHAFIDQLKGKREPKWLINQWWNLVPLKDWAKFGFKNSQEMHWAIEGKAGKRFSENPFMNDYYRTMYRYPQWAKTLAASGAENILANDIKGGQMIADQLFDEDSFGVGGRQDARNTKSAR
jgi:hypothetical protein